jgi:hypothetical protein
MRTPTFIDIIAFIGFWSWYGLIFKTQMPFGWLRKRIYDRWPPDGHTYWLDTDCPQRRTTKLERKVMTDLKYPALVRRDRILERFNDRTVFPVYRDGKRVNVLTRVERLPGADGITPPAELIDTGAWQSARITLWRVVDGEGNKWTTAFTCVECAPRWVILFAALPLFTFLHSLFLIGGIVGFALLVGEILERRRER